MPTKESEPTPEPHPSLLEKLSHNSARWSQSSWALLAAIVFIAAWAAAGPVFHFSGEWQSIMGCVSGLVTLIMVFVLQRAHNKDALTMQIKLNEIIATLRGANNRLINIEDLSEKEIEMLQQRYRKLASIIHDSGKESTHPVSTKD